MKLEHWLTRLGQFLKAMLREAIFLATCNATNVAMQVARKNCNCNCCVASCKKSITTLYFWQHCETSCLRVTWCNIPSATCNAILSEWANQSSRCRRLSSSTILFVIVRVASCEKKLQTCDTPSATWKVFLFVIVALQVARKIASCNMALTRRKWAKKGKPVCYYNF